MPKPDSEGLDDERPGRRSGPELNLATEDADRSAVTIIDGTAHRAEGKETDPESEIDHLRAKVSFLAMQKDYWWQRSIEHAEALRVAESENARLSQSLTELKARRTIRTLS
ncbi:MAG: hypothetical protein ABSC90_00550 [Acidimicrobiales bacterium]